MLEMDYREADATVLAHGDYPTHPLPLKVLASATYTVCCDGAADEYLRHGNVPDAVVGDGDSLSEENRQCYSHLLHTSEDQETNDLTKAVRYLLAQDKHRIDIVGATGKREDHTLGNISLLIDYMRQGADVRMYTDHCLIIPCRNTVTYYPTQPAQQVSVINISATGLQADGLVYPLYDFDSLWQGTLNECTGKRFTIRAQGEYLLLLNYPSGNTSGEKAE